jgi:hypothetical protein
MASNGPFNKLERLLQYMSAEDLLNEVFQGLSDTEAYDILEHIENMWDLGEDEEEEDEEEEEEEETDVDQIIEDEAENVVNKVLAFRQKE